MQRRRILTLAAQVARAWLVPTCLVACEVESACGPPSGTVSRVIDGDTVELTSGERVRYVLLDAPETGSSSRECHGLEAREANRALVEGRTVELRYDTQCRDRFDRLLAYVAADGREVNSWLVQQGHACVLRIPPNGAERLAEFQALERAAEAGRRGLWAECASNPCR